jgi:hypothetical protein
MLRTALSLATLCSLFALTGCPTESTPDANHVDAASATHSCDEIVEHCHDVDPGTGPIHDCHELAHAVSSTEAICAAALENCHAICEAAVVDAGPVDAGQFDAGPTPDAHHAH